MLNSRSVSSSQNRGEGERGECSDALNGDHIDPGSYAEVSDMKHTELEQVQHRLLWV